MHNLQLAYDELMVSVQCLKFHFLAASEWRRTILYGFTGALGSPWPLRFCSTLNTKEVRPTSDVSMFESASRCYCYYYFFALHD